MTPLIFSECFACISIPLDNRRMTKARLRHAYGEATSSSKQFDATH
jgi:hypothetical protein